MKIFFQNIETEEKTVDGEVLGELDQVSIFSLSHLHFHSEFRSEFTSTVVIATCVEKFYKGLRRSEDDALDATCDAHECGWKFWQQPVARVLAAAVARAWGSASDDLLVGVRQVQAEEQKDGRDLGLEGL